MADNEWMKSPMVRFGVPVGGLLLIAMFYVWFSGGGTPEPKIETPKVGAGKGSVVLTVQDGTGKPLSSLPVVLKPPMDLEKGVQPPSIPGTADASGTAKFKDVAAGVYTASAANSRSFVGSTTILVFAGKEATATLKLRKK